MTRTLLQNFGAAVALTFFLAPASPAALTVGADGTPVATVAPIPVDAVALDVVHGIDEFVDTDPVEALNALADAELSRVPEPETVVMIAAGGLLVLLSRLRRRRL